MAKKEAVFNIENVEKIVWLWNQGMTIEKAANFLGFSRSTGYLLFSFAKENKDKIKVEIKAMPPSNKGSLYPRELRLKIFKMYHTGSSYEEIEKETGLSPKVVYPIIKATHHYNKYFIPRLNLVQCYNPTLETYTSDKFLKLTKVNTKGAGLPAGWSNLLP